MSKWLSVLSLALTLALAQSCLAPTEVWSTLTGACCYSDGSCADGLTRTECEAQGGTYMGDETACFSVECPPPLPRGACCYPDGSCADDLTEADCSGQGGTYMGDEITCAGVECVAQPRGACCYPDGSCADDLTQAECGAQGGTYMGDETTCAQVECGNDVKDETSGREKPSKFSLLQNHPNPFNQTTKIEFSMANSGFVSLSIYDLLGRKVRTLASEHLASGYKSVLWDGKNDSGEDVASGIYFCRIKVEDPANGGVGDFSQIKKLVLLK
jgi:hypothetical protein